MGCVFEKVNLNFGSREHALKFIALYNEMLKDEIYDALSESDAQVCDFGCDIHLDDTPIFKSIDRGEQLDDVVERFLNENPDASFYADYECSFSNCGDTTITTYEYVNGVLTIDYRWGELPYENYCEECDYDSFEDEDGDEEPIVRLEDWEEGKVYTCPQCGAVIPFEATRDIQRIKIV